MGATIKGKRYSVRKPLIGYIETSSAEYKASDGKNKFLDLDREYISPGEVLRLRGGKTGFVFRELFINQMQKLNPGFMNHLLEEELTRGLERIPPSIEDNLIVWGYLKGLKTVFVLNENRARH